MATATRRSGSSRTAAGLWHARSYADVGVNEICEVADVRKGSFYHFFASKQELAVAVIDRHWRDAYETRRDAGARGGRDPDGAAPASSRSASPTRSGRLTDELGVMPGCPFGNLAVELSTIDGRSESGWSACSRASRTCCATCSTVRSRPASCPGATDTAEAARAMHAYIEGVLLVSKNANDASIARQLLPLALRLAVEGTPVEAARV